MRCCIRLSSHLSFLRALFPGIALGLFLVACDGTQEGAATPLNDAAPIAEPRLNVEAIPVTKRIVQDTIIGTGTITARRTSNIGSAVEGIIDHIAVKVGDRVNEGDILFQTRQVNYQIAVARAESELALVKAQAQETALEYKRVKQLYDRGNAPKARLDTALTTREAADANVSIADARLAQAVQKLEDTTVRAPYTSVVTKRIADEGVYRSTQITGTDATVIQIQEIAVVAAIIQVPESHLPQLKVGGPAILTIDGISKPIHGTITIINDSIDLETRSVEVRFVLPNPDYLIKPGLFVEAEIMPAPRPVLLVDRKAILKSLRKPYVYVAANGRAEKRSVRIRDFNADLVEVRSGLTENDKILMGPDLPLIVDGQLIEEPQDVAS